MVPLYIFATFANNLAICGIRSPLFQSPLTDTRANHQDKWKVFSSSIQWFQPEVFVGKNKEEPLYNLNVHSRKKTKNNKKRKIKSKK